MKPKKTIYYKDLLNDDFANNNIKKRPLPKNFKFYQSNIFYRLISSFIYYIIAFPIIYIYAKLAYGFKVKGKKKFRKSKLFKKGCFLYGNHTSVGDVMIPLVGLIGPKRGYIISSLEAVSIKGIRWLEMMLGCLPLPDSNEHMSGFVDAINYHYKKGSAIIIFPEAHIWPYCNFIRPFSDASFSYPAKLNSPVFGLCTTYEEHKILKFLKPKMIVHVSSPIYPDMSLDLVQRSKKLRDDVYDFMVETSSSLDNVEYYSYKYKED